MFQWKNSLKTFKCTFEQVSTVLNMYFHGMHKEVPTSLFIQGFIITLSEQGRLHWLSVSSERYLGFTSTDSI